MTNTQKRLQGCSVLVCDDSAEIIALLVEELEWHGARVLAASSGKEALEILHSESVDLVFSDVRMPDGDGVELLKSLRARDGKDGPIVFLATAFSEALDNYFKKLGADVVFAKPYDLGELVDKMVEKLNSIKKQD